MKNHNANLQTKARMERAIFFLLLWRDTKENIETSFPSNRPPSLRCHHYYYATVVCFFFGEIEGCLNKGREEGVCV